MHGQSGLKQWPKNGSGRWPQASAALGEAGNTSCIFQNQALFFLYVSISLDL